MLLSSAMTLAWSLLAWGGLLYALLLVWRDQRLVVGGGGQQAYRALALLGFALTWTFMLIMAARDIARYPDLAGWMAGSNLFFDAYRRVTDTVAAWWWSQQLLFLAPAAILFFHAESVRRGQRYWHYIWVGLCVAVAVALPFFLIRRDAREPLPDRPATASVWVGLSLAVAVVASALLPLAPWRWFIYAILTVHIGVLLAPLPVMPRLSSPGLLRGLYAAFAIVAALSWWSTNIVFWASPGISLWQVVWRDPAQSSITLDVVVTTAICLLWVRRSDGGRAALLFALGTLAFSLGGAFCLHQLWRLRPQR